MRTEPTWVDLLALRFTARRTLVTADPIVSQKYSEISKEILIERGIWIVAGLGLRPAHKVSVVSGFSLYALTN